MGTAVTGKLAAALRRLGFDKVFDTDFAADLTIMEEGTELLNRPHEIHDRSRQFYIICIWVWEYSAYEEARAPYGCSARRDNRHKAF